MENGWKMDALRAAKYKPWGIGQYIAGFAVHTYQIIAWCQIGIEKDLFKKNTISPIIINKHLQNGY